MVAPARPPAAMADPAATIMATFIPTVMLAKTEPPPAAPAAAAAPPTVPDTAAADKEVAP